MSATSESATEQAAAARKKEQEIEAARKRAEEQRQRELEQQRERQAEQQKLASERMLKEASSSKLPAFKPESAAEAKNNQVTSLLNKLTHDTFPSVSVEGQQASGAKPADGNTVKPQDAPAKPAPPALDQKTIDQTVSQLHTAVTGKDNAGKDVKDAKPDETQVTRLLNGLTDAQKTQIEQAYQNQFKTGLNNDVKNHFDTTDQLKIKDVVDKKDGQANYAGDLAVMISQSHKDQDGSNSAIMTYLSTMSADQIKQMQSDFKAQYGSSFEDYLNKNGQQGQEIKHALPLLLKGADQRTAADDVQLVKVASNYTGNDGVALVGAALSGNSQASLDARKQIEGDKDLMKSLDSGYGGNQRNEINDYVHNGRIALTTIINADSGDHKDPANITTALQTATPQEKAQYLAGEGLVNSGRKPANTAEQQAVNFYNNLNNTLNKAGKPDEVTQWKQQLTGDSLSARLAANSKSTSSLIQTVQNMSEQDWQLLKNPQAGQAARAELATTLQSFATPDQQKQVLDLLNQKMQANTFSDSQKASQPILQAIKDDSSAQNVVFSLQHLNPADAEKYKTDAAFRKQVDSAVDGLNGPGKTVAQDWLKEVGQTGKPPVGNATDTALADMATNADKAKTLQDVQKALQSDPSMLKQFAEYQKAKSLETEMDNGHVNQQLEKELKAAGPDTLPPAQQAVFDYIQKNLPPDQAAEMTTSGKLPLDQQLKTGFDKNYVYTQLLEAPQSERDAFLKTLNPKDKQDAEKQIVSSVQNLNAGDAAKYKGDAQFRKNIDEAINGLSSDNKTLAQHLMQQVETTGKPPVPDAVDKALSNLVNGADKQTTLKSIQQALQEDPSLVKSFANYQRVQQLNQQLADGRMNEGMAKELASLPPGNLSPAEQAMLTYAQKNMGNDQAAALFSNGKIALDEQLNLGFSKNDIYKQLPAASKDEQTALLAKLDPQQKQLAEAYLKQDGKPSVADQIRSYVLGNDKNFPQIGAELQSMTPQQKADMFNEYTQKYGTNVQTDFLNKLPQDQTQNYQDLLSMTSVTAQSDLANALINNGDHQHSVEDGTGYTSIRATQEFANAVQAANAFHQALSPEQLEQFNSTINQAQQEYSAAVDKYKQDHPGFWSQVEHIAENVAVVVVSTAVTIGVGAVTGGVGGAIAGGITYALLSQAVNVANGGKWNWGQFGEDAAIGVVFAGAGAAFGAAKGVVAGAVAADSTEAAAGAAAETFVQGGSALARGAAESGTEAAARSTAETATESAARTGAEAAAGKSFNQKLAEIAFRQTKAAAIGGASNVGITAGMTEIKGGKLTEKDLLNSFVSGAEGGAEFGLAGEALGPAFAKLAPSLFTHSLEVPPATGEPSRAPSESSATVQRNETSIRNANDSSPSTNPNDLFEKLRTSLGAGATELAPEAAPAAVARPVAMDPLRDVAPSEANPGSDNNGWNRFRKGYDKWNTVDHNTQVTRTNFNVADHAAISINGRDYSFTNGELKIGRDKNSTLSNFNTVSRDQGVLTFKDGEFQYTDTSSNGTYIQRAGSNQWERLPKNRAAVIRPEDQIRLGGVNGPPLEIFRKDGLSVFDVSVGGKHVDATSGRVEVGLNHNNLANNQRDSLNKLVSRDHGSLSYDNNTNQFVYTDHSSNGSFIQHEDGSWTIVDKNRIYRQEAGSNKWTPVADNNSSVYLSSTDKVHLGSYAGPEVTVAATRGRQLQDGSVLYRKADGDYIVRPDKSTVYRSHTGSETISDWQGKVRATRSTNGRQYTYSYDSQGRLESASVFEKDGSGFTLATTDGGTTWARYDASGKPQPFDGKISVESDGSLKYSQTGKPDLIMNVDGSREYQYANGFHEYRPADLQTERSNLNRSADNAFGDVAQRDRFLQLADAVNQRVQFGEISDKQVAGVYQQVDRLLNAGSNALLSETERTRLAEQVLYNAAHPDTIDQGSNNTCNVTTVESRAFVRNPEEAAKLITDVALTGKYVTPDGVSVDVARVDGLNYKADAYLGNAPKSNLMNQPFVKGQIGDVKVDGERNWADQIFQNTAVNTYWAETKRYYDPGSKTYVNVQPGDTIQYFKDEPTPLNPTGERLVLFHQDQNGRLQTTNIGATPSIPAGKLQDVYNNVVPSHDANNLATRGTEQGFIIGGSDIGNSHPEVTKIYSEQQLQQQLVDAHYQKKLPVIAWVNVNKAPELFGAPVPGHGSHVVLVRGIYQDRATGQVMVQITNQWGMASNKTVPLQVLAKTLYGSMIQ